MTDEATTILFLIPWLMVWLGLLLAFGTIVKWLYQAFQAMINTIDHGHFSRHS